MDVFINPNLKVCVYVYVCACLCARREHVYVHTSLLIAVVFKCEL